jgi:hypothetical protein
MNGIAAVVRLNHGRWIAGCPRPDCLNAEQFGITPTGDPGGLTGSFRCRTEAGGCGLVCDATWPPNVEEIEWLVMQRPVPATRNWEPGEDLSDLLSENVQHGIVPLSQAGLQEHPGGRLLQVSGDRIEGGALTAASWRQEIGAAPGTSGRAHWPGGPAIGGA